MAGSAPSKLSSWYSNPPVVPRPITGGRLNGRTVAVAYSDAIRIVDENGGQIVATMAAGEICTALRFSSDHRVLAAGCKSGRVTLFDVDDRRPLTTYDWGIPDIQALAFAPDGLRIAAGGDGGQIIVWDLE